jgi:hypothetical protein
MTRAAADNTISIQRIVKIAVITAIAFAVGYVCMAILNAIGHGLAAAAGAHPTGRGNTSSQLWVGGVFAVIGGAVARWWTKGQDADPYAARVSRRAAGLAVLAAVLMPIAVVAFSATRQNFAERQQFVNDMASADRRTAIWAADGLAHTRGGVSTLREVLFDAERPADMRLIAGLELAQWLREPPADVVSQVDSMIAQPGPVRRQFVEIYATGHFVTWPPPFERWMLVVLDDPDPKIKLAALGALVSRSELPRPQLCAVLKQLARDVDPHVRANAMFTTRACPDEQIALLIEGARDPEAAVRAAVVKRLGWRFIDGTEDTVSDLGDRLSIADTLVEDQDPAIRDAAVKQRDRLRSLAANAKR